MFGGGVHNSKLRRTKRLEQATQCSELTGLFWSRGQFWKTLFCACTFKSITVSEKISILIEEDEFVLDDDSMILVQSVFGQFGCAAGRVVDGVEALEEEGRLVHILFVQGSLELCVIPRVFDCDVVVRIIWNKITGRVQFQNKLKTVHFDCSF